MRYKELVLDGGYRMDLLVEDAVVVELTAVETVLPVHRCVFDRIVNKLGLPRSLQSKFREIPTDTQ